MRGSQLGSKMASVCSLSQGLDALMLKPSYVERLTSVAEQRMQAERDPSFPPCHWCGDCDAAGVFCESCLRVTPDLPGHALCRGCQMIFRMCRLCRLDLQLRKGTCATVRRSFATAAPSCSCGKAGHLKICSACMCVRYCSASCQKTDWAEHKRVCRFLRRLQPLSFVYPWHLERARRITADLPHLLARD